MNRFAAYTNHTKIQKGEVDMKNKRKKPRPWDREPSDTPDVYGGIRGDEPSASTARPYFRNPDLGLPLPPPGAPAL